MSDKPTLTVEFTQVEKGLKVTISSDNGTYIKNSSMISMDGVYARVQRINKGLGTR